MKFTIPIAVTVLLLCVAVLGGCDKSGGAPYGVTPVQIEGDETTESYDVYQAVAFPPSANNPSKGKSITRDMVEEVLDYYQEKYKDLARVKVMVFRDAAGAVQGVTDLAFAELEMENGEIIRRIVTMD
jgi:hypothetical protein